MSINLIEVEALMKLLNQYQCDTLTVATDGTITVTKSQHAGTKRELTDKEKQDKLYGKVDKTAAADEFATRADTWATTRRIK